MECECQGQKRERKKVTFSMSPHMRDPSDEADKGHSPGQRAEQAKQVKGCQKQGRNKCVVAWELGSSASRNGQAKT